LSEITIKLEELHPVEILGTNNQNLRIMQQEFPQLKLHVRGNEIRVKGELQQIEAFEHKLNRITKYVMKHRNLPENRLTEILHTEEESNAQPSDEDDILVYGNNGLVIRTKTENQQRMYEANRSNDLVFATGPAGTGKTYTAVAIAVKALKNREIRKIILTRPAVEAGESLGFLPGDIREKVDPYLQPLYDALHDMLPPDKLEYYIEDRTIEIAPLAFMRGRTLDNAFVILDEAQNATSMQLKMFLTRMGPNAKFIVNGDLNQVDLPPKQNSGLIRAIQLLQDIDNVAVINLTTSDVTRHKLVKDIISAYEKDEQAAGENGHPHAKKAGSENDS
jgi:phosphate starvation-inducible PhoH-like protein